jgi:hypothetical protein
MISQPTLEVGKMRADGRRDLWNGSLCEPTIGQETDEPLHAAYIFERLAIVPVASPLAGASCRPIDDVVIDGIDRDARAT